MMPGMFAPDKKPFPPFGTSGPTNPNVLIPPKDTLDQAREQGKMIGKGIRMAGEALRTAFGGGAITGESADRRQPTEQTIIGNPMAHPMAADSVKMPQDLRHIIKQSLVIVIQWACPEFPLEQSLNYGRQS